MVGCVSGYCGGMVDVVIMRIVDILDSIPYLIYVIIIMIIFGSGLLPIMLALTLTGWLSMGAYGARPDPHPEERGLHLGRPGTWTPKR